MDKYTPLVAPILILIYIIITFLFSAFEKLFQWKESVAYYKVHFKDSFLKKYVSQLLIIVIILEVITSTMCLVGIYFFGFLNDKVIGFYGLVLAAITLIVFMLGQRFAKDYNGAMNITVYFILTIIGAFLLQ